MRNFIPLIFAVILGPPVAVSGFQQWINKRPHVSAIDEATAEKQIKDDPSICSLAAFPEDRAKAMGRAQCWIDKVKDPAGLFSDLDEALMTSRRAVAERYINGAVTAIQAEEEFEAKKIEVTNLKQQRFLELSNAYSNDMNARAAVARNLQPISPRVGFDCKTYGSRTHCGDY